MTPEQLSVLNGRFATSQYLKENEAAELSEMLGLTVKQVHNWYGKRRYTMKQKAAAVHKPEVQNSSVPPFHTNNDHDLASVGSGSGTLRPWKRLSSAQIAGLVSAFHQNPYLQVEDTEYLSERLGLSVDKIRIWYANKRKSMRRFEDGDSVDSGDKSPSPSSSLGPSLKTHYTMNVIQSDALNFAYASSPYLENLQADELSMELGISTDQVRNWYSNRRASQRKGILDSPTFSNVDLYTPTSNSPNSSLEPLPSMHPGAARTPFVKTNSILSSEQSRILNESFLRNPYESEEGARDLAVRTGLTVKQVQTWYNEISTFEYSRKRFNTKKRKRSTSPSGSPSTSSPHPLADFKSYHMLTPAQTNILNSYYERSPYVDDAVAVQISSEIGVTVEKIKTWFKSKRKLISKKRKQELGNDGSVSSSSNSSPPQPFGQLSSSRAVKSENNQPTGNNAETSLGNGVSAQKSGKGATEEQWSGDEEDDEDVQQEPVEEESDDEQNEDVVEQPVDLEVQEEQVLAGLFGIDVDAVKQLREQFSNGPEDASRPIAQTSQ
ncbi:UNVERIFIED_CONTAM: hypothetical protein HDU68_009818 [Siphonaria sp. JEL0065]|nr:hypothetical protein HDU68_009818 [Siphonaria sp. JEL0065]